jgi:ribosomal protein S27AE
MMCPVCGAFLDEHLEYVAKVKVVFNVWMDEKGHLKYDPKEISRPKKGKFFCTNCGSRVGLTLKEVRALLHDC